MSPLRIFYLLAAIAGFVAPMFFFLRFFRDNGFDLNALLEAWAVNDATRGLTWDLTIAAVVLTVFIIVETMVRRDYWIMICIPAIYCVGLSFGLPLYLFLRSRTIH